MSCTDGGREKSHAGVQSLIFTLVSERRVTSNLSSPADDKTDVVDDDDGDDNGGGGIDAADDDDDETGTDGGRENVESERGRRSMIMCVVFSRWRSASLVDRPPRASRKAPALVHAMGRPGEEGGLVWMVSLMGELGSGGVRWVEDVEAGGEGEGEERMVILSLVRRSGSRVAVRRWTAGMKIAGGVRSVRRPAESEGSGVRVIGELVWMVRLILRGLGREGGW